MGLRGSAADGQTLMMTMPILDRQSLLTRLDGDEELAGEILALFIEDAPLQLSELDSALTAHSLEQVARVAHTIKGAAANIGGLRVEQAARALEAAARAGSEHAVGELAADLRVSIADLIEAIALASAR
jgi:HPt (histidine-containing phosphotransfer) domain-containing protein